jgi:hypothetical protein
MQHPIHLQQDPPMLGVFPVVGGVDMVLAATERGKSPISF